MSNDNIPILAEHEIEGIRNLAGAIHEVNTRNGWWNDIHTGADLRKTANRAEKLMLIVSEISEAMEGERSNLMDDKIPTRPMAEVEIADAIIRCLDYGQAFGYDIAGAIADKLAYNANRADHKKENRLKADGKKF